MRRRIYGVLLSVFLVLSIVCLVDSALAEEEEGAAEGKPVAVVENDSFDCGSVYEGVDVFAEFVLKNTGDADLEVTDVKSG